MNADQINALREVVGGRPSTSNLDEVVDVTDLTRAALVLRIRGDVKLAMQVEAVALQINNGAPAYTSSHCGRCAHEQR